MPPDAHYHFGHFVRWKRLSIGGRIRTTRGFAAAIEMSEKRVIDIEKMPTPDGVNEGNLHAIARALGTTWDALDRAWRTQSVPVPKLRADRTGRGKATLQLPADVLAGLEYLAGKRRPKQTVAEYLAEHVADRGYKVTISPLPPSPGRVSSAASPAGHTHE